MGTLREWVFVVERGRADAWSDALLEAGALSVQADDVDADSPDEVPRYGEPGLPADGFGWERTRLSALLPEGIDVEAERALLAEAAATAGEPWPAAATIRTFDDADWVRLTQSQFEPIPIGARLLVTPSWHAVAADEPRLAIVLDPGLAFGTGSHPTTRLCLEWLDAHPPVGSRVIDYGCGSGLLAIAAARLGAAEVEALDIDPQAVASTRDNAARNAATVQARVASSQAPAPADVVLANILSSPLKLLAPLLQDLVRPGGWLVLSGILERQADEVAASYTRVPLAVAGVRDGWVCLAGRRP